MIDPSWGVGGKLYIQTWNEGARERHFLPTRCSTRTPTGRLHDALRSHVALQACRTGGLHASRLVLTCSTESIAEATQREGSGGGTKMNTRMSISFRLEHSSIPTVGHDSYLLTKNKKNKTNSPQSTLLSLRASGTGWLE